jgi:hypothetical protein
MERARAAPGGRLSSHLDRVEGGDHPLNRLRFSNRIARHQLFN